MKKLTKVTFYNYLLLFSMAIIWGGQFALNKIALHSMDPTFIMVWRAVVGFITLFTYTNIFENKKINHNKAHNTKTVALLYLLIGLTEIIIPSFLIAWGCKRIDSGIAAILMCLVPIFTMLIAYVLNKKTLRPKIIFAVLLGFIGIVILVHPNNIGTNSINHMLGILALALAAFNFAIGITLIKFLPHNISAVKHMQNILSFSAVILILFYLLFLPHTSLFAFALPSIIALLVLGIFAAGIAYVMYITLVHRTSSLFTSFVNYMIPVVGVLIGNIFMHEPIAWDEVVALICVLGALYLITPQNKSKYANLAN